MDLVLVSAVPFREWVLYHQGEMQCVVIALFLRNMSHTCISLKIFAVSASFSSTYLSCGEWSGQFTCHSVYCMEYGTMNDVGAVHVQVCVCLCEGA